MNVFSQVGPCAPRLVGPSKRGDRLPVGPRGDDGPRGVGLVAMLAPPGAQGRRSEAHAAAPARHRHAAATEAGLARPGGTQQRSGAGERLSAYVKPYDTKPAYDKHAMPSCAS